MTPRRVILMALQAAPAACGSKGDEAPGIARQGDSPSYHPCSLITRPELERDPNRALESASQLMPSIEMPGVNMPHFREMADVVRRAGIYGPRDYLRIVEEAMKYWAIEALTGLNEMGKTAQEKILAIPARLERVADMMETRSQARTLSFAVAFAKEFQMA